MQNGLQSPSGYVILGTVYSFPNEIIFFDREFHSYVGARF